MVVTRARPVTSPSSKRHEAPKPAVRKASPVVIEKPKPVVVDEPKYYSPKKPIDIVEWQKPKPKQVMDKSKPQPVLVARSKFYDEKPRPRGSELEPQEYDENKPVRWSQIPLALETFILQREDRPITTEVSDVLKVLRNAEEDAESVSSQRRCFGEEDTYHRDKMQDKLSHFMSGRYWYNSFWFRCCSSFGQFEYCIGCFCKEVLPYNSLRMCVWEEGSK
jgi:hypothetical protein